MTLPSDKMAMDALREYCNQFTWCEVRSGKSRNTNLYYASVKFMGYTYRQESTSIADAALMLLERLYG